MTETEVSSCLDESRDLLEAARGNLGNASAAYVDVDRELSRLDFAYDRLEEFVGDLRQENSDLRPLVNRAAEHARQLQIQADELDR